MTRRVIASLAVVVLAGIAGVTSRVLAQEPATPAPTSATDTTAPPAAVAEPPAIDAAAAPAATAPTSDMPAPEAPVSDTPPADVAAEPSDMGVGLEAGAGDEALAAELAKLGLSEDGGGTPLDTSLKFSGFADFSIMFLLASEDSAWRGAVDRHPAFSIGNFNLYLSKNLTESLRMFGEVRFTLLPNGSTGTDPSGAYVSTVAQDYADFDRPLKWAGIEIERVYLEWAAYRALTFRLGMFLTPYGVWNVDHGSPTIITVQRPFIIGQALFPERQTGIEVLGQFDVSAHNTLGYHATLSNGTGPVSEYRDFDANKALGARVFWRNDGFGELTLGGSFYWGMDTASTESPGLTEDGMYIEYTETITSQSLLVSLAADLQWKYEGFLLQTELITQQRRYDEEGRVGAVNPLLGQYLAPNDKLSWGLYGLIGYRFEWLGIMPYFLLQTIDTADSLNSILIKTSSTALGLNIRPIDVLVVKVEWVHGMFPDGNIVANETTIDMLQFQIAWAF
jgi:hypothetical protein